MSTFTETSLDEPINLVSLPIFGRHGRRAVLAGSGVVIAPYLALTAAHVIEDFVEQFTGRRFSNNSMEIAGEIFGFVKHPTHGWVPLKIVRARLLGVSDLAMLDLAISGDMENFNWSIPRLQLSPPKIGDVVHAYGFAGTQLDFTVDEEATAVRGTLNLRPSTATGVVTQIHQVKRDSSRMPFPCFETDARMDGAMSGGPVLCDGSVCGLVCSSLPPSEEGDRHVGYAVTLWPILTMRVRSFNSDGVPIDIPMGEALKLIQSASDLDKFTVLENADGTLTVETRHWVEQRQRFTMHVEWPVSTEIERITLDDQPWYVRARK